MRVIIIAIIYIIYIYQMIKALIDVETFGQFILFLIFAAVIGFIVQGLIIVISTIFRD